MNEVNNNELSEFSDIKQSNNKKILIILLTIFILTLLSLIGVNFLYLTPQSYFNNTLEKLITLSKIYYNNSNNLFDKDILSNYTTSITMSQNINKISFNLNGNIGYDKNHLYLTGELKDSNAKLLDFNIFTDNQNKLYLDSKDIFDKTLLIDINKNNNYLQTIKDLPNINDSISYLSNKIINSYKNNYDSNKLKKNIEHLKIVNKKVLTMKVTNEMNSKELEIILNKIIDELINDDKSLQSLSAISNNMTTNQVKDSLLELKNNLKNNLEDKNIKMIINYSILSKEIVYIELQIDKESIIIKQEDNIYYLNIVSSINKHFKLDIQYNTSNRENAIIYNSEDQEITLNIKNEKISDKEYNYAISLKGNASNIKLTYDLITTIKLDEKLETFDTTNPININNLTEEEKTKITNNLYSILLGNYILTN